MNSVSTIDLLRHGETQGGPRFRGSTDDPLTGHGWAQMWTAVENKPCWDRIIASPLARCADFARALARQRSMPFVFDERIKEMHFGRWEGRSAAELMTTDPDSLARFWNDPAQHAPPNAEPLAGFEARVLSTWRDIVAGHPGEKILLITHGGVIRAILCHILQRPIECLLEFEVGYAAFQRIRVERTQGHSRAALVRTNV